jgi:Fic family protein
VIEAQDKAGRKRKAALEALKALQKDGRRVFRSSAFESDTRRLLVKMGYLEEVIRGWLIASSPPGDPGDITAWYASFWQFAADYLNARFGDDWVLTPEQSLSLHAESTTVPRQVLIHSSAASNNVTKLLHGTTIYDHKSKAMPKVDEVIVKDGLHLWSIPAGLIKVPEHYYAQSPTDAAIAMRSLRDPGGLIAALLDPPHPVVAGRLAGAFRHVGRSDVAERILEAFHLTDQRLTETNPFGAVTVFGIGDTRESPVSLRLRAIWAACREAVVRAFRNANLPSATLPNDIEAYLAEIEDLYRNDAYNSLSIEGYQVTDEIIERVSSPEWSPDNDAKDRADHDALAARGYYQAFLLVKEAIQRIVSGADAAQEVKAGYIRWYQQLFQPMVLVGKLRPQTLAGHRRHPVYLRGSRFVPPRSEVINEAMDTLMDLIANEPEASVRAVLGHWLFGYVHPFPDGNGRTARFVMNALLAGGGYPWTVIHVEVQRDYLEALNTASIDQNVGPFADFIAHGVRKSYSVREAKTLVATVR